MLLTIKQKQAIFQSVEKKFIGGEMQVLDVTDVQVGWIMPSGKIFDFGINSKHREYKSLIFEPFYSAGIIVLRKELPRLEKARLNITMYRRPLRNQIKALMTINNLKILHWWLSFKGYNGCKYFIDSNQGTGSKRLFILNMQTYYKL